jgi:hypothetical protein
VGADEAADAESHRGGGAAEQHLADRAVRNGTAREPRDPGPEQGECHERDGDAADEGRRALLESVLNAEPGLREAVRSQLEARGEFAPADLSIEISTASAGASGTLNTLEFEIVPSIEKRPTPNVAPAGEVPVAHTVRPKAKLIVFSARGANQEFEVGSDVVNVGRVQEVRGSDHRPLRRNHLHFAGQEPSVSRQHAHIRYDPESGEFRIFDDRSARGTRLFSNGSPIDVPAGRSRGEVLHSGDEIYFGSVGVRFEIIEETN